MQVVETKSEGLARGFTLTLPAETLSEKIDARLEAARADVQMKGFRKGKAPLPLLKKMFGQSILGEVVQESVDGAVREHFEQTGDRPALQPDVKIANETVDEGHDLTIELEYEKLPEVPEVDFSAVRLERPVAEVEEGAVEEALANLAESATDYEAKEGAAEEGDQIVIDFVGKLDGEPFEGGAAEDFPLVIGSGQFIPGFEPQLVGLSAGEERQIEITFPEDYQAEHLAGKATAFDVTVKEVRAPKAAAIDDELAKRYGADDLEALKAQIRERLEEEYRGAGRQVVKRRLMDALDETVSFDLPPSLVDAEAKQIAHQMWHEAHPEVQGHDHEEIEPTEEHVKLAERRVRLGLLLAEIGNRNGIEVTDQEINQSILSRARQMGVPEKAFFDYVRQNQGALQQIRAPIFEEKVVDYVLELAEIEETKVTKDELQKMLEDEDAPAPDAG